MKMPRFLKTLPERIKGIFKRLPWRRGVKPHPTVDPNSSQRSGKEEPHHREESLKESLGPLVEAIKELANKKEEKKSLFERIWDGFHRGF